MPTNKNAMTRYKILDELLSDKYHNYSLDDLTNEVNKKLDELGVSAVSRRCIEKDLQYIEVEGPFFAEITRYNASAYNPLKDKSSVKKCLKYTDPSFSIFKKSMTEDERYVLSQALSILGQFDGLPNLDGLNSLRNSLNVESDRQIISFSKNPLDGTTLIGELFTYISHRLVVELTYFTFQEPNVDKKVVLHPYFLKEYNRRWFLFGAADSDNKLLNFGLERIRSVMPLTSLEYRESMVEPNELFEDIIGVTLPSGKDVDHIEIWVSDYTANYIITKPLHESQIHYKGDAVLEFRKRYPRLKGGCFFSIDCIENFELIRELSSYGKELLVLSPSHIQTRVYERAAEMSYDYKRLVLANDG